MLKLLSVESLVVSCFYRGRDEFLTLLKAPPRVGNIERLDSDPWAFVEEDLDEVGHVMVM